MRYVQSVLLAVLLALLFYGTAVGAQSSNISAAINSTSSYIQQVNQSSYLIFYPNLTAAYNYLGMAKNESQLNQDYAFSLLSKADQSAKTQQALILRYQDVSVYTLAALAVFLAIVLYIFMKPNKKHKSPSKRPK
jgi:type VI protein secretion system component VasF